MFHIHITPTRTMTRSGSATISAAERERLSRPRTGIKQPRSVVAAIEAAADSGAICVRAQKSAPESIDMNSADAVLRTLGIVARASSKLSLERKRWILAASSSWAVMGERGFSRWCRESGCPIPRRTLCRYLHALERGEDLQTKRLGRRPVLSEQQERMVFDRAERLAEELGRRPRNAEIGQLARDVARIPVVDGEPQAEIDTRVARCGSKDWVISWAQRYGFRYARSR